MKKYTTTKEATKQQKRKDKAAISVQALHKLEEIAHPSDSFLFYHDVEKEIEQGTGNSGETRKMHCNENETNSYQCKEMG